MTQIQDRKLENMSAYGSKRHTEKLKPLNTNAHGVSDIPEKHEQIMQLLTGLGTVELLDCLARFAVVKPVKPTIMITVNPFQYDGSVSNTTDKSTDKLLPKEKS